ncbi:hypothetical protein ACA30_15805 [Virgibacillus soli]|nr:hypothetical protein ACA30_15805 [Virgibacillus soli]
MREVLIDLNKYFAEVAVTEEQWTDIDGSVIVDRFKELKLAEGLTLTLADDGSATVSIESEDISFTWDAEAAELFERFRELKVVDMFGLIQRKRWGTA